MIDSGLLDIQSGAVSATQAAKPAGTSQVVELFSASRARVLSSTMPYSPDPVTKGTFRKSLEEFTGPISAEHETSSQPAVAFPAESSANASLPPSSSLLDDARAIPNKPPGLEVRAQAATEPPQASEEPVLLGNQDAKHQARLAIDIQQAAATIEQRAEGSAQGKLALGKTATAVGGRQAGASGLKLIAPHRPETLSLDGTANTARPQASVEASSGAAVNDKAGITPSAPVTTSALTPEPPQSLVSSPPALPSNGQAESLPVEANARFQSEAWPAAPPAAAPDLSASQLRTLSGKPGVTKTKEAKSNQLGLGVVETPSPPSTGSVLTPTLAAASTQPALALGGHLSHTAAGSATTSSQPLRAAAAGTQLPAAPVKLVDDPLSAPTVLTQSSDTSVSGPTDPSSSFAQSLSSQVPTALAGQRPAPFRSASAPDTLGATSTFRVPAATGVQVPSPPKPDQDKSPQFIDQLSTGDTAAPVSAPAQHNAPASLVAESSLPAAQAMLHPLSTATQILADVASTVGPSSAHAAAASLSESSTVLSSGTSVEAGGLSQHTTLVATPNVLEVGVASGSHGWLKVRAELDGSGAVSASVTAGSTTAAATMHKELPALAAYLSSESVGVSSLVVNQSAGTGSATAGAAAQDAALNLGAGAGGGGPARDQAQPFHPVPAQTDDASREGIDLVSSRLEASLSPAQMSGRSDDFEAGSWLSVRA